MLVPDRVNGCVTIKRAREPPEGREDDADPGPRRGHSMTTTTLASGEAVACVVGGWGNGEVPMTPHLLSRDADDVYHWRLPDVSGEAPALSAAQPSQVARAIQHAVDLLASSHVAAGWLRCGCLR